MKHPCSHCACYSDVKETIFYKKHYNMNKPSLFNNMTMLRRVNLILNLNLRSYKDTHILPISDFRYKLTHILSLCVCPQLCGSWSCVTCFCVHKYLLWILSASRRPRARLAVKCACDIFIRCLKLTSVAVCGKVNRHDLFKHSHGRFFRHHSLSIDSYNIHHFNTSTMILYTQQHSNHHHISWTTGNI